jgi:hypothetical protein
MVDLPLPELKKKVIYIDQNAFSDIMKMLSPETQGHEGAAAEPLWRELYETLDVVCHLQLVACPDSAEHEHESLTSPFPEALKHTYEHFSGGLTFRNSEQIKLSQIVSAARCFARKQKLEFDLDPERIVHGRLHGWQHRMRISVSGNLPGTVDRLRQSRGRGHAELLKLFQKWQADKRKFRAVFEQERSAFVPVIFRLLREDQERAAKAADMMMRGQMPGIDALMPSPNAHLLRVLAHVFETEGARDSAAMLKDFLDSGVTNMLPFNVIESLLFASLSQKAASGQKKMPNQGTLNDISVVSTLLPYCDAMFVDNGCRALLHDIPKPYKLAYLCKVFSKNTSKEFLAYLRSIRESVKPEHRAIVEEVYGSNPMKPRGIYGIGKHKEAAQSG